jgi:hypothetical protein
MLVHNFRKMMPYKLKNPKIVKYMKHKRKYSLSNNNNNNKPDNSWIYYSITAMSIMHISDLYTK